jgi:hypothetical protein
MSRWVCLRCFEPNDAALPACAACGLPRGTQPTPDEMAAQPAAGRPGATRGTLLSIAMRFWWVVPMVAIGAGGILFNAQRGDDGQVSRSGDMLVSDLRIGDCYDLKDASAEEVNDVTARPCAEPHGYELMFIGTVPGDAYPTDSAFEAWLERSCLPAFADYVGTEYLASALDIAWFSPTEGAWNDGDHAVQCAVYDPGDGQVTGALRNSNR